MYPAVPSCTEVYRVYRCIRCNRCTTCTEVYLIVRDVRGVPSVPRCSEVYCSVLQVSVVGLCVLMSRVCMEELVYQTTTTLLTSPATVLINIQVCSSCSCSSSSSNSSRPSNVEVEVEVCCCVVLRVRRWRCWQACDWESGWENQSLTGSVSHRCHTM